MKKLLSILTFGLILLGACTTESDTADASKDIRLAADAEAGGAAIPDPGGQDPGEAGLITAGEWNDLDNWSYWLDLVSSKEHGDKDDHWGFYTDHRIAVRVKNGGRSTAGVPVDLLQNGRSVWHAITDNHGRAELWISPYRQLQQVDMSQYALRVNGRVIEGPIRLYNDGTIDITISATPRVDDMIELAFIVDATGSMADELEFLKKDLRDVITQVQDVQRSVDIRTASVFYRDEGDDYVTRQSDFTDDLGRTMSFIKDQSADGGGDFPEAVHSALQEGIQGLRWSDRARTKIAFLLLDAPPHHERDDIQDIKASIQYAAERGIKVIPITASGIDKETEFLMRYLAMLTNGTYVFITNHSGIGEDHIEPTVGEYDVEYLNNLMVRLITKYSAL